MIQLSLLQFSLVPKDKVAEKTFRTFQFILKSAKINVDQIIARVLFPTINFNHKINVSTTVLLDSLKVVLIALKSPFVTLLAILVLSNLIPLSVQLVS